MRRMFLISLFVCMVSSALTAQKISNVRSSLEPNCGYYTITFDLKGKGNELYLLKLIPYLGSREIVEPRFVEGPGLQSGVAPGKDLQVFWNPVLEGAGPGNWQFRLDSKKFPWVLVEGGTFTMGDTRGEGSINELPTHSVTLNSFYMGKYEVTQSEWIDTMGSWDSDPYGWGGTYGVGDNYPVYYVSWYAVLKYCNLRSMAEGLTPVYSISGSTNPATWGNVPTSDNTSWNAAICDWNANGYRLPTEAEWEYAARGATNTPDYLYSGSDDINDVAWYDGNNSPKGTKPVGTKAPNGLGLYDMSGNLWEWCWDWYSSYSSSPQNNPNGPASGSLRVLRGGYWSVSADYCRVANRYSVSPSNGYNYVGFRLCRAVL